MSRKRVLVPRGLVAVRPRRDPGAEDAGSVPEPEPRPAMPAIDLKTVQRRAFERGRAVALSEAGQAVAASAQALSAAATQLAGARGGDRRSLEEFAVRLACVVAGELVATVIDAEEHDVRAMVRRVLDGVLPDLEGEEVTLEGHPEDLGLLPSDLSGTGVLTRADDGLARGSFRVVGGDTELYSGINDRLEQMKERLLTEGANGPA